MKYPVLLGVLAIGLWSQVAMAQTFDLTLTATGPSVPPSGVGSVTVDTVPPGTNGTGIYTQGPVGNDLLTMSFTLGTDTFDLSDLVSPNTGMVQFGASGNVTDIAYFGLLGDGDSLLINGLTYTDTGASGAIVSMGTISSAVTPMPEPATMGILAVGLAGLTALRRRHRLG